MVLAQPPALKRPKGTGRDDRSSALAVLPKRMNCARLTSLSFVLCALACTVDGAGDTDTESETSQTATDTQDTEDTQDTQATQETEDSEGLPDCEFGDISYAFAVDLPPLDPPAEEEGGQDTRSATCVLDSTELASGVTTLELSCDELDGPAGQAYSIEFSAPEGETLTLDPYLGLELTLDYHRWWAFEAGNGTRVALEHEGELLFLAYRENSLYSQCQPGGSDRIEAEQWLARVGGQFIDPMCAPPSMVSATFDDASLLLHGGQIADLAGGQRMLLAAAACGAEEFSEEFNWDVSFAAWIP